MKKDKQTTKQRIDEKMLAERRVFLWGQVDDASARYVIDRLIYLDAVEPGKEITFYINSPGGYVTSGMAIYDVMKSVQSPVATVCMGLAASMGSILLSAGEKGKRSVFPHGKIMIHQPSGGAQGLSADIEIQAREIIKTKELGARILAENCGQTFEKIMKDFDRDYWLDAKEAIEYGIVDNVVEKLP
ncbi:ATP-dependent Clp protease proteolytic subunit [Ignavibacteria bacterium]|nr:ATP-dependent Clp protease proteolytic subunit [Bacteroidota bacterium]MCZ2131917.1 ATP-dependent Clp protease proteolytic subunit [Bacteroidota bacterium]